MTSQSLPANVAGCPMAKEVHRNAMANERFTGRSISAPWYRKSLQSQMTWLSDSRPPRPSHKGRGLRVRNPSGHVSEQNPHPSLSLAKGEASSTPAASRCTQSFKLTIDLLLFSGKHRKCFCLLDVSAASGLHCSCWV